MQGSKRQQESVHKDRMMKSKNVFFWKWIEFCKKKKKYLKFKKKDSPSKHLRFRILYLHTEFP